MKYLRVNAIQDDELGRLEAWLLDLGLEVELETGPPGVSLVAFGAESDLERAWLAPPVASDRLSLEEAKATDWGDRPLTSSARWFGPLRVEVSTAPHAYESEGLLIDPGPTFGSGLHPSTALLLQVLVERRPSLVLDVGTGSGILALAALRLGARRAVGTDLESQFLEVARANAQRNRLSGFETRLEAPEDLGEQFPFVVANILPSELADLAPRLIQAVAPRGSLWLSGLRNGQEPPVVQAYRALGVHTVGRRDSGPWCALELCPSW